MEDSAGLALLEKHRNKLEKALRADLKWLAHELHHIGFLNDEERDDVTSPRPTFSEAQRSGVIVTALHRRVELDPADLGVFVDVLKRKPKLFKHAINLLDSGKKETNSCFCCSNVPSPVSLGQPETPPIYTSPPTTRLPHYPPAAAGVYYQPQEPLHAGFSPPPHTTSRQPQFSAAQQSSSSSALGSGGVDLRTVDSSVLDLDDDYADVFEAMKPLAASWDMLATHLRLPNGRVAVISRNHSGNCDRCLAEVLKDFLKKNYHWQRLGEPSWRLLVWAVSCVDQHRAEIIAAAHRVPQVTVPGHPQLHPPSLSSTPGPLPPPPSLSPAPPGLQTPPQPIVPTHPYPGLQQPYPHSHSHPTFPAHTPEYSSTPSVSTSQSDTFSTTPPPSSLTAVQQYPVLSKDATLPLLTLIKWTDHTGQPHSLRLMEAMSTKWKEIGGLVGISEPLLSSYEMSHMRSPEHCIREVVMKWRMMCSEQYPATWLGLIKLLEDLNMHQPVKELLQAAATRNSTLYERNT